MCLRRGEYVSKKICSHNILSEDKYTRRETLNIHPQLFFGNWDFIPTSIKQTTTNQKHIKWKQKLYASQVQSFYSQD